MLHCNVVALPIAFATMFALGCLVGNLTTSSEGFDQTLRGGLSSGATFKARPLDCQGPCRWNLAVPGWVHTVNHGSLTAKALRWCTIQALEKSSPTLMTNKERNFFIKTVSGARTYFEWGPGHSTYLAFRCGLLRITSVDAVQGSIACVLAHPQIAASATLLRGIFVDIDADPERWALPRSNASIARWPSVSDSILFESGPHRIDVAFVDGRFRSASIVKAAAVLRDDASILVHDYPKRPGYHFCVKEGLCREVKSAGRMVLLRRGDAARAIDALPAREALARWREKFAQVELLPQ